MLRSFVPSLKVEFTEAKEIGVYYYVVADEMGEKL